MNGTSSLAPARMIALGSAALIEGFALIGFETYADPAPEAIEKIARENNVECLRLGVTMKERLQISNSSETPAEKWIDCRVDRLREVWENALESLLNPVPVG